MSQENVEIVRRTIEAYTVGDREAYYDFMEEDIEIRPDVSRWPEAKPFCGREEFRRFNADIDQDWAGGARAEIGSTDHQDRILLRPRKGPRSRRARRVGPSLDDPSGPGFAHARAPSGPGHATISRRGQD